MIILLRQTQTDESSSNSLNRHAYPALAQIALYEWVHDLDYNQEMARDTRRYDFSGVFRDSRIPVLAIEGWWSPVWGTWRSQRLSAMRAAFPGARIEVFRDSAHFPFRDEPQRFFETLRGFLQDAVK